MNKKLFTLSLLALATEQGSTLAIGTSGPTPIVDATACCPQPMPVCCPSSIVRRNCCPRPFFFKISCRPVCAPRIRRVVCAPCPTICRPKPICCPRIRCCRPKPVCCPQPIPPCPPPPCVQPVGTVVETPQPVCPIANCPLAHPTQAPRALEIPHSDTTPMRISMRADIPPQDMTTAGSTAADIIFDTRAPVQEALDY